MQQTIEGYRLAPQQRCLWLAQQRGGTFLATQGRIRITGDLDRRALREALRRLVARHEILRTSFESLPGMELPIQVIREVEEPAWREIDLAEMPEGEVDRELEALAQLEVSLPLPAGAQARFALIGLGRAESALLATFPALCVDARSLVNLFHEIVRLYQLALEGSGLLDDPLQYVQFSEWQNDLLEEEGGDEGRQFWLRQIAAPTAGPLRTDRPADPGAALELAWRWRIAPEVLRRAERAFGGEALPDLLLTAWSLLLSRLAGTDGVIVRPLFDGRRYEELHGAVGLFARHLPLRLRVPEAATAARFLERVHELVVEGVDLQEYSAAIPELDDHGGPSTGFELLRLPGPETAGGARLCLDRVCARLERPRLLLSCVQDDEGIVAEIVHDGSAFTKENVIRLAGRLEGLLRAAVEAPYAPVADFDVLTEEERRRLFVEWNGEAREVTAVTLPRLFAMQAARFPGLPAIVGDDGVLSFAELDRQANRLAHRLVRLGAGPDVPIAICLPRGIVQHLALWGILKAGAALVPLDPAQPRLRLLEMLEDAGITLVVTDRVLWRTLALERQAPIFLDDETLTAESEGEPATAVDPENLAYVLYTSGSTGRPKGVMVRHWSVINLLQALEEKIYCGAEDGLRVSQNAPLSFDASVKQWGQLLRGRPLVIIPEEIRGDGEALLAFLERREVGALDCTPSQLHLLLEAGLADRLGALRRVLIGGEAVSPELWARLAALPQVSFFNVYGPTECTVDVTVARMDAGAPGPVLGRPLPNVRGYVLDHRLRPLPAGSPGELCVGGAGVARGYLNRPDQTAEKFIPDPFGGGIGERLYRTGDLVRWGGGGMLEFLGRIDDQVKLRGFRVELGEIETALREHPGVERCAVVVREDEPGLQRLIAYVVPKRRWAPRIEGRPRRELPNGLAVVEQSSNETDHLYEEIFRKCCYLPRGVVLSPGACVFDVGANIGMFTLFVRELCPSARVFAFEPIAPIYETLRINAELYAEGTRLFPFGLSDRERTEPFIYYPQHSMLSSQSRPAEEAEVGQRFLRGGSSSGAEEVGPANKADALLVGPLEGQVEPGRLRRLSEVLREEGLERLHLLKIGVQGAEMDVLQGIDDEHWPRIDQIVVALHESPENEGRVGRILDLLRRRGFRAEVEQDGLLRVRDRYNLYAVREGGATVGSAPEPPSTPPPILTAAEIREALKQRLPEYMVPAAVVLLQDLPLNRNGKVDRSALPAPEPETQENEDPISETTTPFEEILLQVWADILKVPSLGVSDNFFDLGGHSLLATQLVSRVREIFRIELPLRALFDGPTISLLAERVVVAVRSSAATEAPPLVRTRRDFPLPMSFAQQRLWFIDQLAPGSPLYNSPRALRLLGRLDVRVLAAALTGVMQRHEALRTTFSADGGEPVQKIGDPEPFLLPVVDLAGLPDAARESEERRVTGEEARRPFDLARGPLLRAWIARSGGEDHLLLVTMHHIVSDAWSMGLLFREISTLYEAISQGHPSPLPELPIQYADFAAWQRQWLSGEALTAELAFWRQWLQGTRGILELPTDRPRPVVRRPDGSRADLMIPERLAAALRMAARRESATLFMVLLAGFQALLGRYSGQEDFNVGSPIAGRNRSELEGLIGFFVNTLVLRADLSGDPPFAGLVGRVREAALQAYAHQDLPFEKLVDELAPERSLGHSPLFQVVLGLQSVEPAPPGEGSLVLAPVESNTGTAKFDLSLTLVEDGRHGVLGSLEYSTDLFDAPTVQRFLGHFRRLLEGAVANPGTPWTRWPLLGPEELHQVLIERAGDGGGLTSVETTLHQLFQRQACRAPEASAVSADGERLSYAELDRRAIRLARHLVGLGVVPEARVGLCVERSVEMVVGMLAILKAGGAYVPLDPAYPEERLRYLLEDAQTAVLLTQSHLRERLPEFGALVVEIDHLVVGDGPATGISLPAVDPAGLAYVIYTSGSTGRPKGVGVTHANVVRLLAAARHHLDIGPGDVWSLFHSHAFDFSVWELWGALAHGARVVVVPTQVSRSPARFLELLRSEQVTLLNQTPSAFRQLVEESTASPGGLSLRYVIFGGEALDLQSLKPWLELYGDQTPRLVNMYGITETTVHVTYRRIVVRDLARGAASVIGWTLPGLSLYLLDGQGQPVPIGVPGEMYVGGTGVARGYLGRPVLTAERFVPDPFAAEPGARMYRSGDLSCLRADGEIEYLGRIDHQVKIRGFRIELGEIEAALGDHPGVRQALVLTRGGEERRLIAYLVPGPDHLLPSLEEIRAFLQRRLPEHMIPAVFVPIAAVPLTPHGKVDRAALPDPERDRLAPRGDFAAPRTAREKVLAEIWAEVLGVEQVGVDDNFFTLGGDSILSIRVRSLAARRGVAFELQDLFLHQTLGALAEAAQEASGAEEAWIEPFSLVLPEDRSLLPAGLEDAYPLARLQLGMLFHGAEAGPARYHNVSRAVLRGPWLASALTSAVEDLTVLHPVLRTSFNLSRFSEPLQLVHRAGRIPFGVVDLRGLPPDRQPRILDERLDLERTRRFDASVPPLLRIWVHLLQDDTFELGWTEHHAILDGWSVASLIAELFDLYFARLDGRTPIPRPPDAAFRDFVALERRTLAAPESRRYWAERLGNATFREIPRWPLPPQAPSREQRTRTVPVEVSADTANVLARLAQTSGMPLKSVLLAAHLRLLESLGGDADVVAGIISNGRPETGEGERVLGLFLNTLPLRLRTDQASWLDLVRAAFDAELEMLPHRRYPLSEIQREHGGGRPLFESVFNFVQFHVLRGVQRVELLEGGAFAETNIPLFFKASRDLWGDHLRVELVYDTDILLEAQVRGLADLTECILAAMAANPSAPPAEVAWPEAPRHQILCEWNETPGLHGADRLLHELVAGQGRRAPGRVAVIDGEREITYGDLLRRAESVAACLGALGLGPEARVGVCLPRSVDLIAALLGCFIAGAAYVPLEPDHPAERLALLVEDSGLRVLVTCGTLRPHLPEKGVPVVNIEAVEERTEKATMPHVTLENLAYLIYTSGTTGRPKGVGITHGGAASLMRWAGEAFSAEELGGMLASTSVSFDLSVFEIFAPLCQGGTVILADNILDLPRLPAASRVRLVSTVPSAAAELLHSSGFPPGVRTVCLAGEALPRGLVDDLYTQSGAERVVNLYGPSEDTTYSTGEWLDRGERSAPPIGRSLVGRRSYVVDVSLRPTMPLVAGELVLGGTGLSRGYLGRPELTAERFVPDPLGGGAGDRLYRTGDLVRRLPDGRLEFMGRIDHQVKVRGFRIELGEVEAALLAHPGVREAVVVAREDRPGEKRLVSYVVAEGNTVLDWEDLRHTLAKKLPSFMVPSLGLVLTSLPRTPNGKIDRGALPVPEVRSRLGRLPRTPMEEILTGLVSEVLGHEEVGVESSFLDLGGHSLLALRLVARVRASLQVELPVRAVFESPTLAALAERIEASLRINVGGSSAVPPLERVPRGGTLPLSFAQERLWFLDQLNPGAALYNIPTLMHWPGELDFPALCAAWNKIVQRHEALRTIFPAIDGRPLQRIHPPAPIGVPVIDLSGLAAVERRSELRRLAMAEARRPFELCTGPLLRVQLLRLSADDHLLISNLHHAVADGWSLQLLRRELATVYAAYRQRLPSPLAELRLQPADHAIWQRRWLRGEVLQAKLAFWRSALGTSPVVLDLPTDRPRPPLPSYRGVVEPVALSAELTERLEELARREGATLFLALLAGWQALLSRLTGQGDIRVGTPVAGRDRVELESMVGLFVNTLVLRGDLTGSPSLRELLGRLRQTMLDAWAHQDLPFEKLVAEIEPERSLSRSPLFQVMLVLQRAVSQAGNEGPGTEGLPTGTAKFDLTLSLLAGLPGLRGALEYSAELFDRTTVRRLVGYLEQMLSVALERPGTPMADLPLLSAAESHQLTFELNDTAMEAAVSSIPRLFIEEAWRSPDRLAVVAGEHQVTYGELLWRADTVAAHLADLGVGAEARVGVCLERSADLIWTLLGVLASGGAYVPLDPGYPAERLAFMVADSGLQVLITRGGLRPRLPEPGVAVVELETLQERAWEGARPRWLAESLAYVIYTSGSTGRPKGVGICHASAASLIRWAGAFFSDQELDGMLASTSVSFDLAVLEIFAPLCHGGTVILSENALELPQLVAAERVRMINTVPSVAAELVRSGGIPSGVRSVCLAGEVLPRSLADQLSARPNVERVVNLYGPTEDTTYSTGEQVEPGAAGAPSIGRPLHERRSFVVDGGLRPVPPGVAGELLVGGRGLARGYLGQPELTAAQFVPDPLGGEKGDRLYRTGDLVRRLTDGRLEYLGRIDHQVKVRGFRIELGEIEAALRALPWVQDAVVMVREDRPGDRRLVAYVIAQGKMPHAAILRRQLAVRLPEPMLPSAFVLLQTLPLTPNGKVDRKALPAPEHQKGSTASPETPRDEVELWLLQIWEEILGTSPIRLQDDFFTLNGDSLLAARLMARIERDLQARLPLTLLFQRPTIEQLATEIRRRGAPKRPGALQQLRLGDGGSRPLFLIHPAGGSLFCYTHLARQLGDRPCYGLQTPEGSCHVESLEEMAKHYLAEVRQLQPVGPYLLGGWSMGGLVALEMAQQIRDQGGQVGLLALLDPALFFRENRGEPSESVLARLFFDDLVGVSGARPPASPGEGDEGWASVLERARQGGLVPPDLDNEGLRRQFEIFGRNLRAAWLYAPRMYDGCTLVLAPRTDAAAVRFARWQSLLPNVEVQALGDDHYSFLRPPAIVSLAEVLRVRLAQADPDDPRSVDHALSRREESL